MNQMNSPTMQFFIDKLIFEIKELGLKIKIKSNLFGLDNTFELNIPNKTEEMNLNEYLQILNSYKQNLKAELYVIIYKQEREKRFEKLRIEENEIKKRKTNKFYSNDKNSNDKSDSDYATKKNDYSNNSDSGISDLALTAVSMGFIGGWGSDE